MKKLLFVLLMLIAARVSGQSDSTYVYQSFFGKDSTTVNLYTVIIDGDWNLTFTLYNSDTITMNNHLYYYVEPKQIESVPGYVTYNYSVETIYFREDRQNGRLYLYVKNNYVEKEILLCDMSLNVGDTFSIPTYRGSSYEIKVRNIRMVSGRKTIEFGELHTETLLIENMMFMEGLFPMAMPMPEFSDASLCKLICQHKDGEFTYNPYFTGNCLMETKLSIGEVDNDKVNMEITPTIFSSNETISIESDFEIREVKMIDMLGREINISINPTDDFTSQISLNQKCNSGIYLIIVETEKDVYYEKVVLRD